MFKEEAPTCGCAVFVSNEPTFLMRVSDRPHVSKVRAYALTSGDMPQVCADRRHVSFMYSYSNYIPVDGVTVSEIVRKLEPYKFAKLYGAWPKLVVSGDPKSR